MFSAVTLFSTLLLLVLLLLPTGSDGLVAPRASCEAFVRSRHGHTHKRNPMTLFLSQEEGEIPSSPKRRRKRKGKEEKDEELVTNRSVQETASPPPAAAAAAPTVKLQPRNDSPVQFQVQDVRTVVGGEPVSTSSSTAVAASSSRTSNPSDSSAGLSSRASTTTNNNNSNSNLDDSLQQLLEDARQMKGESSGMVTSDDDADGGGIKATIGKVLSTIVTADFFVVCGFLLWFLLGIFCSSILKDDTIQIAFNNNFELLVQPALGVLMIASIASNFFKEEDEGDMMG